MKNNRLYHFILFSFFFIFTLFLAFSTNVTTVHAVNKADIENAATYMSKYDGISNWKEITSNQIGKIPIGKTANGTSVSLDYTFGAARDANGNVKGGDTTVTKPSPDPSSNMIANAPTSKYGKINVFLDYGGKYYGILHQGPNSYIGSDASADPGSASNTSMDFALMSSNMTTAFYKDMNVIYKLLTFDSANGGTNKILYAGTDANKKPVYKIAGFFSQKSVYVEEVLRPSITGAPIVSRELYVYNEGSKSQFQTFYGEDTALDPSNGTTTVDNVPMFSIGDGSGLYLKSDSTFSPTSKLFITNDVNDGFTDFMGRVLTNPSNWGLKGAGITSSTLPYTTATSPSANQKGDTAVAKDVNLLNGTDVNGKPIHAVDVDGKQDSAYTLRWSPTNLEKNQVAHFASNIGATVATLAIPKVTKTYTNLTSSNGTNNVGDKLRFTLNVKNEGYQSVWAMTRILDQMPTGLTIDQGSISSDRLNGNSIDFNPNTGIADGASYPVTFTATINNQAPYNQNGYLTNKVSFTGNNGHNDSATYSASVDIPVATPTFKYRFTKLVRNNTDNPSGAFTQKVTAKQGDTVQYQIQFISNGSASLSSADFADTLPDGLELVKDKPVTLNGAPQNGLNFKVGNLANNTINTISYQAKVTGVNAATASNTAYLQNVNTSGNQSFSSIATEVPADVEIQAAPNVISLDKVPDTIDFGTVNTLDKEKIIPNYQTNGDLKVTHTQDKPFQVQVSYDNDGDVPITNQSDGSKLIQDDDDALFFNQDQGDNQDHWNPITTSPLPIKSSGFSGSYNGLLLNSYVGKNKWRLRVPASTKAGVYKGNIVWSIYDTI